MRGLLGWIPEVEISRLRDVACGHEDQPEERGARETLGGSDRIDAVHEVLR